MLNGVHRPWYRPYLGLPLLLSRCQLSRYRKRVSYTAVFANGLQSSDDLTYKIKTSICPRQLSLPKTTIVRTDSFFRVTLAELHAIKLFVVADWKCTGRCNLVSSGVETVPRLFMPHDFWLSSLRYVALTFCIRLHHFFFFSMMIYFIIYHDGQHNFSLMTEACDRALSDLYRSSSFICLQDSWLWSGC